MTQITQMKQIFARAKHNILTTQTCNATQHGIASGFFPDKRKMSMPKLVEQLSEESQKSEVKPRPSPVVHFDFEVNGLKGPVL